MTQPAPRDEPRGHPVDAPRRRADLRALGLTDDTLQREHTRLMRGQWLHGSVTPDTRHLLRAALQRAPDDAFLTHDTAAAWHGGIVPPSGVIHLGTTSGKRMRAAGLVSHRYTDRPEVVIVRGLPVTAKPQTFSDVAPLLGLVDLVVFGDSLSLGHPELPEELRRCAAASTGRGAVNARRAAALVRDGAESAQETRTRLLMVLAGLPEPKLQHPMLNEQGKVIHRLDMAHVEAKVAIEYDGDGHLDKQQRSKDVVRRARFEDQDWRFIDVVSADIFTRPHSWSAPARPCEPAASRCRDASTRSGCCTSGGEGVGAEALAALRMSGSNSPQWSVTSECLVIPAGN